MDRLLVIGIVALTLLAAIGGIFNQLNSIRTSSTNYGEFSLVPTGDPEELAEYRSGTYYWPIAGKAMTAMAENAKSEGTSVDVERYSTTNVQVIGVDEPDVLKINGSYAFFTSYGRTKVLDIWPPEDLNVLAKIDDDAQALFIEGDTLITISWNRVVGYDVREPDKPEKVWEIDLNGGYVDARLYDGKIYLVTRDYRIVCPYVVAKGVTIPCSRYYHPIMPMPQDVTYTILKIDAESGKVETSAALTGTYQTTIYMSKNGIYFAHRIRADSREIEYRFLLEEGDKYLPRDVMEHLRKVWNYDIGKNAKLVEMEETLERYMDGLGTEERADLYSRIQKGLEEYMAEHPEIVDSTGITRFSLDDLSVVASGTVPGHLMNQWAIDEKDGHLRVATTTTANWRDHIGNNIYVLDGEMKIIGRLEGLEKGERIYAVRFMGEKAYIVTYRETDPLFVVDLSDPRNPRVEGILKIPGYSTYLHPIGDGRMVGVGKDDDGKVKISLFDVSDPENPKELDVYHIDAWWSEAIRNHHAFLWDPKAEIVALPVGTKYYVLGVGNNEFRAERVVDMNSTARRAAYVNNYLYLFGDGSVVVVDEENFDIVARKNIDKWNYVFPEPRPLPVEPV